MGTDSECTNDVSSQTTIPDKHTVFKYQIDYVIERRNVKKAFEKSPDLVPFVLLTNDGIKSITKDCECISIIVR